MGDILIKPQEMRIKIFKIKKDGNKSQPEMLSPEGIFGPPAENMVMTIYTGAGNFIGECELNIACEARNIIEINSVVTRPGYGKVLYDFAMEYATLVNGSLVSARDGESCEPALKIWLQAFSDERHYEKHELEHEFNEQLINVRPRDEFEYLYFGYSKPISTLYFASGYCQNSADREVFSRVKEKSEFYFHHCYAEQSAEFIDIDDPILADRKKRQNYLHMLLAD
jgi:hypothetical protein